MYQEDRLEQIRQHLQLHQRISVSEIMELYGVSRDTARRDLVKLSEQEVIIRTRGGAAFLNSSELNKSTYPRQSRFNSPEKQAIARQALSIIQSGETLLFDTSILVQCLAEILNMDTSIVTNSLNQAEILASKQNVQIHLLGGILNKQQQFLYGGSLMEQLQNYFVDKVFIGGDGIFENGISFRNEEDAMVKKAMTHRGKQVIVLADQSRFGKRQLYRSISFSDIDLLITDQQPTHEYVKYFNDTNVTLIVAK